MAIETSVQLFVIVAVDEKARENVTKSLSKPITSIDCEPYFKNEEALLKRAKRQSGDGRFYAWGSRDTRNLLNVWMMLRPGDYVLVHQGKKDEFTYWTRFIARPEGASARLAFARDLWDLDENGQAWNLVYFLERPRPIPADSRDLSDLLRGTPRGFHRVAQWRVEKIVDEYGSVGGFISERLGSPTDDRHFGHPPGVQVGDTFESRASLKAAGVHRQTRAGIAGSEREGAESIVVSGGYVDDEDYGDFIIYTGHGGRDETTGRQMKDQELRRGNLALARSWSDGLPVRVARGPNRDSPWAPETGYRYDGLYYVEKYWPAKGLDLFRVYLYRLIAEGPPPPPQTPVGTEGKAPERRATTIERIVRSSAVALEVKRLHRYICQICGTRLVTTSGFYAEGAHIRPLGKPHDGPDTESNVLCLCPNHHVLFDSGAITLQDDMTVVDSISGSQQGKLRTVSRHRLNLDHVSYHRNLFRS